MGEQEELGLFREDHRVFLGWDEPVRDAVVDFLLSGPGLARAVVLVPTAGSGRILRQALAERGGALAPVMMTPGGLLGRLGSRPGVAPDAVEILAWVEVLEGVRDWDRFAAVFPSFGEAAGEQPAGWALGLARSLVGVRRGLQERGLTMAGAERRLANTVDSERWQGLADLESEVERLLGDWELRSRSQAVRDPQCGIDDLFPGVDRVVMASVTDVPEVVVDFLSRGDLPMAVLVAAPEERKNEFDEWGRPLAGWAAAEIAWPEKGSVRLVGDTRDEAEEAMRAIALGGCDSNEVALGSADEETAEELERVGARQGWPVYFPGKQVRAAWTVWLGAWRNFLRRPGVAEVIDLLGCDETGVLVRGKRAQRVQALSRARDRGMVRDREDLARAVAVLDKEREELAAGGEEERAARRATELEGLTLALDTMETLGKRRASFLREGFHRALGGMLSVIDPDGESGLDEWLEATSGVAEKVGRDAGFWIDLVLAGAVATGRAVPDERVLDVVGWLELFFEPGRHLVVCGMNEGLVPAQESSDPWLPEGVRRVLGLSIAEDRAARDAYLLTAMMKMRSDSGRVDLLLAKATLGGDVLQPSRLLLAARGRELAERVEQLFQEVEPLESGLAWSVDRHFQWQRPEIGAGPDRLSVTAFSDYLSCPFRFALKHLLRMQAPEPERVEWNARDFGTVAHLVLENWGKDEEAREFSKTEAIAEWVHAELDRLVAERFGERPPLAVRIQAEALRQRLSWFAHRQACERASGWRVVEVERNFSLTVDGMEVRGQVDRIEEHADGRRRILDYKTTAEAKKVDGAHLKRVSASTRWPEHLEQVAEVLSPDGSARWVNLQVPIYAAALGEVDEIGYFALGATEADVGVRLWDGFGGAEEDSAMACARWVIGQVQRGQFWPPAERVQFDDYEALSLGRALMEAFPGPEYLVEEG